MKKFPQRARQAGFTLVELMVSMAIGLAIVLALLILLVDVNRHNSELGKSSRMVENGRYALQVLGEDIAHAGYWGGYVPRFDDLTFPGIPNDVPAALPDPCLTYTPPWTDTQKSLLVGVPVQGYEIPSPVPSPTLGVCADKIVRPKANTDVLFVRHTETCVPGVGSCPAVAANELYFQVARCGTTVIDPGYVMSADATALTAQNRDCTTTAELRKLVSNLYYVRDHAVTVGDGIPTLMRSQFGLDSGALQH
ncbi:MAG: prepilin-type N-terminal cleavage/methylation domain-containing protein, partial [Pseudomonadota bacterium]